MKRQKAEKAEKIVIRPMTEEDIQDVVAVDRKISGQGRSLTYGSPVDFYIGGEVGLSWVAEVSDAVVGFVLCSLAAPGPGQRKVAWLGSIGIDPDHRRRGIARELVDALVGQCRRLKIEEIHTVADRHDELLESFFRSTGLKPSELLHYSRPTKE